MKDSLSMGNSYRMRRKTTSTTTAATTFTITVIMHFATELLLLTIITTTSSLFFTTAKMTYQDQIPNGASVMRNGDSWPGVGHEAKTGSGPLNLFGIAFRDANALTWTMALCQNDTDGDGFTDGMELGDPNCTWTVGGTPDRTSDISHPGYADSMPSGSGGGGGNSNSTPDPAATGSGGGNSSSNSTDPPTPDSSSNSSSSNGTSTNSSDSPTTTTTPSSTTTNDTSNSSGTPTSSPDPSSTTNSTSGGGGNTTTDNGNNSSSGMPTTPSPPPSTTPAPPTPAPTPMTRDGPGVIVPVNPPLTISASMVASLFSQKTDRRVILRMDYDYWSEAWCADLPSLRISDPTPWSREEGITANIGNLVGSGSITCNATHLTFMAVRYSSFFLKFNDSVGIAFTGDYTVSGKTPTNPVFYILFIADQPGANPPTPSPPTLAPGETMAPPNETSTAAPTTPGSDGPTLPPGIVFTPSPTDPNGTFPYPISSITDNQWAAAAGVAFLGVFAASASFGGPFASSIQRASILHHDSCRGPNVSAIPFPLHPLQTNFQPDFMSAGAIQVSVFANACFFNMILIIICAIVHCLAGLAASVKAKGIWNGFGVVGFPGGATYAMFQMLAPGIIYSGAAVLINGEGVDGTTQACCVISMIFVIVSIIALVARLTKLFFARGHICTTKDLWWVFSPTVIYGDRSMRRKGFCSMWGKIFSVYNYKRQWWSALDLVLISAQLGFAASRPSLFDCTDSLFIPLVVSLALYLFAVLVMDPFHNFFDRFSCFILSIILVSGFCACAAIRPAADPVFWATTIDQFGIAIFAFIICYCITSIVVAVLRWRKGIRFQVDVTEEDVSDDETQAKNQKEKAAEERRRKRREAGLPSDSEEEEDEENETAGLAKGGGPGGGDPNMMMGMGMMGGGGFGGGQEMSFMGGGMLPPTMNINLAGNTNHEEADPDVAMVLLRGEWFRIRDQRTGMVFYYNPFLRKSSWDLRRDLGMRKKNSKFTGYVSSDDERAGRKKKKWKEKEKERRKLQKKEEEKAKKRRKKLGQGKFDPVAWAIESGEWKEHTDASGKKYYSCKSTKKTTWDLLGELKAERHERKTKDLLQKGTWKEATDQAGSKYFYNPKTKKTCWDLEEEFGSDFSVPEDFDKKAKELVGDDGKKKKDGASSSSSSSDDDSKDSRRTRNSSDSSSSGSEDSVAKRKRRKKIREETKPGAQTEMLSALLLPGSSAVKKKDGDSSSSPKKDGAYIPPHVFLGGADSKINGQELAAAALVSKEWVEVKDPSSGTQFYFNPSTQESVTDLALHLFAAAAAAAVNASASNNPLGQQQQQQSPEELASQALASGEWYKIPDPTDLTVPPTSFLYLHAQSKRIVPDLVVEMQLQQRGGVQGMWAASFGGGGGGQPQVLPHSPASAIRTPSSSVIGGLPDVSAITIPGSPHRGDNTTTMMAPSLYGGSPALWGSPSPPAPGGGSPLFPHGNQSSSPQQPSNGAGGLTPVQLEKVRAALTSGKYVMFVDNLTGLQCYRHAATGRIIFDLAAELGLNPTGAKGGGGGGASKRNKSSNSNSKRRKSSSSASPPPSRPTSSGIAVSFNGGFNPPPPSGGTNNNGGGGGGGGGILRVPTAVNPNPVNRGGGGNQPPHYPFQTGIPGATPSTPSNSPNGGGGGGGMTAAQLAKKMDEDLYHCL